MALSTASRRPLSCACVATSSDAAKPSALPRRPRKGARVGNVDGSFWVDSTCIDCDACRWIAPGTFTSLEHGR
jgi:hypothetical protein